MFPLVSNCRVDAYLGQIVSSDLNFFKKKLNANDTPRRIIYYATFFLLEKIWYIE